MGYFLFKRFKMDEGWSMLSVLVGGCKYVLGTLSLIFFLCRTNLEKGLRLSLIFVSFTASASFGTMYIMHAQEERLSPIDRAQEEHMRNIDQNYQQLQKDRDERRAEALAERANLQSELDSLKNREFEDSKQIGNVYAFGSAFGVILGALQFWIGFLLRKAESDRESETGYKGRPRHRYRSDQDVEI